MAIPTYDQLIEPLLRFLNSKPQGVSTSEVYAALADAVGLTDDEREELLPSRRQRIYQSLIGLAHDRLERAGLSESRERGTWQLTDAGRTLLADHPDALCEEEIENIAKVKQMPFDFSIPSTEGQTEISIEAGSSVVFVGANGGGKTRLAVRIEETLSLNAHRISAHRALTLNPSVAKIGERAALSGLRTGYSDAAATIQHRIGNRWQSKAAVSLLNDFDFLIQALFADQANK